MEFVVALGVWVLFLGLAVASGYVRVFLLSPRLGETGARLISSLGFCGLIVQVSYLFVKLQPELSPPTLLHVGLMWLVLSVVFEFGLGRYAMGYSWRRLMEDYNLIRGRMLDLGLIWLSLALSPYVWSYVLGP